MDVVRIGLVLDQTEFTQGNWGKSACYCSLLSVRPEGVGFSSGQANLSALGG
jgi:hypothetical protein